MNKFERTDAVFIQQGSSNALRVENENKWYVIREEWQGSRLLNSVILSSHDTDIAAETARDIYKSASALGRKGGLSTSDIKKKSSAENGRLGGRPKIDKIK